VSDLGHHLLPLTKIPRGVYVKDLMDMTMTEALVFLRETGAGMTQHVIRDKKDDKALAVIIIIDGEETQELLDAIEQITREW
jgi:hypothetical protein